MTRKNKLLNTAAAAVIGMTGFVATPVFAQATVGAVAQSGAPGLEEVIVTARRREETAMKVPVAVSVMSSAAIEATRVADIDELSAFTPGLISAPQIDRSQNRLVFRGLSTSFGQIFIDGAPYTGTNSPDLSEVQRVEVLGGPQSVYFGRATFAGAVNFVTRKPGNEFAGRAMAGATTYGGSELQLSLEGPVIPDVLGIRVSARNYQFGGQYNSFFSGAKLGKRSTNSASVALATITSSPLQLSGYYSYARDDDGPPEAASLRVVGPGPTLSCNLGGTGGPYYCGALPKLGDLDPRQIGDNTVLYPQVTRYILNNETNYPLLSSGPDITGYGLVREVHHLHGRADYSLDSGWQLSALTAYSRTRTSRMNSPVGVDSSTTPNVFAPTPAARATACATPGNQLCFRPDFVTLVLRTATPINDFSFEGRVSSPQDARIRGTAGASYFRTYGPVPGGVVLTNISFSTNTAGGGIDSETRTPAVFGGLYFDVTEKLTVSAEGRYQWDKISRQPVFPTVGTKLAGTFKSFSPRFTVDYDISPTSMVYANFARGYRPGGFNAALTTLTAAQQAEVSQLGSNIAFAQEKLDSFELGHKATWMDRRLRTTLAAYYTTWMNGQVSNTAFYTTASGAGASISVISNIGRVDLKGVEFTGEFAATQKLTVATTVDFNDSEIKNFVYTPGGTQIRGTTDVKGNKLDRVSKLRATVSPSYRFEIGGDWSAVARMDYQYRSKYFVDPTNSAWIGGRSLVNARLAVSNSSGFTLEAYVRNLFNDDTLIEAVKSQDALIAPNPAVPCAPCFTAAAPPVAAGIPGNLNKINLGLPEKRLVGVSASMKF